MYSYIKGIIKKITPKYIVLENNAIGYQIITANPYSFSLNDIVKKASLTFDTNFSS